MWYHLKPVLRPQNPSDPDDARLWPSIGGVRFDPRDVGRRESLFSIAVMNKQTKMASQPEPAAYESGTFESEIA